MSVGDAVEGAELPPLTVRLNRTDLVRYAAATGDLNPIHWSDRVAREVGLPGVVAHGMLTMALGGRLLTAWTGDPGAVLAYRARFTRPVPVPDVVEGVDEPGGEAVVELSGTVTSVHTDADGRRTAEVKVVVAVDGRAVLGRATATVRLPAS